MASKKTFEQNIQEIRDILNELNSSDIMLDEGVKKYETGVKILKDASKKLENSKIKIMGLNKELTLEEKLK